MKFDKKHPKFTAYALNEVSENDKKKIEKYLSDDQELKKDIEEIQDMAQMLEQGFASEKSQEISARRLAAVKNIPAQSVKKKNRYWLWGAALAPAMAMLFMFINHRSEITSTPSADVLWSNNEEAQSSDPTARMDSEVADDAGYRAPPPAARKPKPSTKAKKGKPSGRNLSDLGLGQGKILSKTSPGPQNKSAYGAGGRGLGRSGGQGSVSGAVGGKADFKKAGPSPSKRKRRKYQAEKKYNRPAPAVGMSLPMDKDEVLWQRYENPNAANKYSHFTENDFLSVAASPLSTFSIDVDTASYSVVRQYLNRSSIPPVDSVRLEEMINYFDYSYAQPTDGHPFAVHLETANTPWREGHRLVRIGLKGREVSSSQRKKSNLVFLIDVSGSMRAQNKLPLLKRSFRTMVRNLRNDDLVSIVVYAGASGLVLPPTPVRSQQQIFRALDRLQAGGSTNGGSGIQLAFQTAQRNLLSDGNNRVILATDGDFNVGTTGKSNLVEMVRKKSKSNIFLTVLGFGMGNYKDDMLETLADKGNGNYAYIDTDKEARKVFGTQLSGTLETIAKDVKIQVEFNPHVVQGYRLLGYENRKLAAEDFNDDRKDAGEIGAGHTVTAIYEVVPVGVKFSRPGVDPLKYQKPAKKSFFDYFKSGSKEMMTVKLRYKDPKGTKSKLLKRSVKDSGKNFSQASEDFRFAASVAAFGMILRNSKHKGAARMDHVIKSASSSMSYDPHGYRSEFLGLARKAAILKNGR